MTVTTFLVLLSAFTVITGLVTEAIKQVYAERTNLVALIVALIVGCGGTCIYYQLNGIVFDVNNIIYAILMGFASGLAAMCGYDKVKQAIEQFINSKE